MSSETIEPVAEIDVQDAVRVACTATEHVSLASYENAIPVIREIVVANLSDEDLLDLRLRIESRPAVVQPLTLRIDRVPAGSNHHIETPDIRLDAALLAGFTEASRLELTSVLEDAGGERARNVAATYGFDGVRPADHMALCARLRQQYADQARMSEAAVLEALRAIQARTSEAERAANFLTRFAEPEDIARAEKDLLEFAIPTDADFAGRAVVDPLATAIPTGDPLAAAIAVSGTVSGPGGEPIRSVDVGARDPMPPSASCTSG